MMTPIVTVPLKELYDPETGRLDAQRIADYLRVTLTQLAAALGKKYQTLHKTPASASVQTRLQPIKRTLDILAQLGADWSTTLAWLNSQHPDLGMCTPLELILAGHADAVTGMLEDALEGTPS